MSRPVLILAVLLVVAVAALAAWRTGGANSSTSTHAAEELGPAASVGTGLVDGRETSTRAAPSAPVWNDPELIAALELLGRLPDLLDPELEQHARPILIEPARVTRSLELLQGPQLVRAGVELSFGERGATLALGLAAATYGRPGGELPAAARDLDRHALVVELIEALPLLRAPVAAHLVSLLERLRLDGRPVVGAGFFQVVLDLRRGHPQLGALLDQLLQECAAELPGEQRRAIARLFVNEGEDATLVKVAFAQLLSGEGSGLYLQLARERLGDAQTRPEVQRAILEALASAAPLGEALDAIAPHLDVESVGALVLLSKREGGVAALVAAYDARLTGGLAPEERRWLVAGLEDAGEQDLLHDIARTDPDRSVRGQAMLSVSLNTDRPTTELLDDVLAGRDQPGDPFIGLDALHSSMALSNLALRAGRAGAEELASRALDEVRAMVLSGEFTPRERRFALRNLSRQVPAAELAALQAQLEAQLEEALEQDH